MEHAFSIHKRRLEQAGSDYQMPVGKEHPTTMLWAKAEEVALITNTKPNRWLRYGVPTLERALIYIKEKSDVKNRAALLTWAVHHYHKENK